MREKLISVGADLTLDQAVDISKTYELSQSQLKAMKSLNCEDVHGIGKQNNKYKSKVNYSKPQVQTGKNVHSSDSRVNVENVVHNIRNMKFAKPKVKSATSV